MHVGNAFFCVEARALFAWVRFTTEALASESFNDAYVTRLFVAFPYSRERWPTRLRHRAVECFLQRKADRCRANVLLRDMMVAWGRHVGVFPPPLVSDDSSDGEMSFGLASSDSTDSDDE